MPRVLTCMDPPPADGTPPDPSVCVTSSWIEQTNTASAWPQLTAEQGSEIGQAFALGLVAVAVIRVFLNPKTVKGN